MTRSVDYTAPRHVDDGRGSIGNLDLSRSCVVNSARQLNYHDALPFVSHLGRHVRRQSNSAFSNLLAQSRSELGQSPCVHYVYVRREG